MSPHVCPASHAGFLSTSLRRIVHNPEKILGGLLAPGQRAMDIGCGPGFFTLPMARLVGENGVVIAADLQPAMLDKLRSRAEKEGVCNIGYHVCRSACIGADASVDFILAFYMVHEVPDPEQFFLETRSMIRPGGRLLFVEPKFHVSRKRFEACVRTAEAAGWQVMDGPRIWMSRAVLLD